MKIVERKKVTHTSVDEVIIGRKCDICGKEIEPIDFIRNYNYFVIHTWHYDWGNDSVDSHEYKDACCPECVIDFAKKYVNNSFEKPYNSHNIQIEHVRSLGNGARDE